MLIIKIKEEAALPLCCLQLILPLSGNGSQLNAHSFSWCICTEL